MKRGGPNIESDRVRLFEVWGYFRERIRQQRGGRQGVQRSLVPMLSELLDEVKEGFEAREIRCKVRFGRLSIVVTKMDGEEVELGEAIDGQ